MKHETRPGPVYWSHFELVLYYTSPSAETLSEGRRRLCNRTVSPLEIITMLQSLLFFVFSC